MTPFARLAVLGALVLGALGLNTGAQVLQRYRFCINETTSLPDFGFVIDTEDHALRVGDLAAFVAPDNRYYPRGAVFAKRVLGVGGDRVTVSGSEVFVSGRPAGKIKPRDQQGRPTHPGPIGVIPAGSYFMSAPSADSLDSRYAEIGWIASRRIVGKARAVL